MQLVFLKEIFKEWAESTEIHGIKNILSAKSNILRMIWISCFFASFGYCIYQITDSFLKYFDFDVISNYNYQFEVPTEFPTVDICNLNPYDGNQLRQLTSRFNSINDSESIKNPYYIQDIKKKTNSFKYFLEYSFQNDTNEFYVAGFYIYQMLLSCLYNNQPCLQSDFQYYHNYFYGSCYSSMWVTIYGIIRLKFVIRKKQDQIMDFN